MMCHSMLTSADAQGALRMLCTPLAVKVMGIGYSLMGLTSPLNTTERYR